jgi:hypothetical protein
MSPSFVVAAVEQFRVSLVNSRRRIGAVNTSSRCCPESHALFDQFVEAAGFDLQNIHEGTIGSKIPMILMNNPHVTANEAAAMPVDSGQEKPLARRQISR